MPPGRRGGSRSRRSRAPGRVPGGSLLCPCGGRLDRRLQAGSSERARLTRDLGPRHERRRRGLRAAVRPAHQHLGLHDDRRERSACLRASRFASVRPIRPGDDVPTPSRGGARARPSDRPVSRSAVARVTTVLAPHDAGVPCTPADLRDLLRGPAGGSVIQVNPVAEMAGPSSSTPSLTETSASWWWERPTARAGFPVLGFPGHGRLREERPRTAATRACAPSSRRPGRAGPSGRCGCAGSFRGRNLFGDLPPESRRGSSDWVIADQGAALGSRERPRRAKAGRSISTAARSRCAGSRWRARWRRATGSSTSRQRA